MADRDARGGSYRPPDVLAVRGPKFDAMIHVGDVVQVRVCYFPKKLVHAPIKSIVRIPRLRGFSTQLFEKP
jgi:hypothetical protein